MKINTILKKQTLFACLVMTVSLLAIAVPPGGGATFYLSFAGPADVQPIPQRVPTQPQFNGGDQTFQDDSENSDIDPPQSDRMLSAYQELLTIAESSPYAQFSLSKLLSDCSSIGVSNRDELQALEGSGKLPPETLEEITEAFESCEGVLSTFDPGDDVAARSRAWLETSADSGFELAKAEILISNPGTLDPEKVLPPLYGGLQYAFKHGDDELKSRAILQAQIYHSRALDAPSSGDNPYALVYRGESRDAWDYLGCKYSSVCEISWYEENLSDYYSLAEIEEMRRGALKYERALVAGEMDTVQLAPDVEQ